MNVIEFRKPVKALPKKDSAEWLAYLASEWVADLLKERADGKSVQSIICQLPALKQVLDELRVAIRTEAKQAADDRQLGLFDPSDPFGLPPSA